MANGNVEIAKRWFEEVWNQGRDETIDELFAANARMHGVGGPRDAVIGPDGFREHYKALKVAFPEIRFEVHAAIGEGDLVAVRWTATATHTGPLLNIAATGKPICITGMGFARIENGQIAEAWNNWDMMGLMHAIDQIPHAEVLPTSAGSNPPRQ